MDHALLDKAIKSNDPQARQLAAALLKNPLYTFKPRPDRPELYDQQTSFYLDKFPGMSCAIGGTGSGKSFCGAARMVKFLAETPPPEKNTQFWVLSKTLEMVSQYCWGQNLSHFLPYEYIQDIVWYSEKKSMPKSIILKPHSNGNNFLVEFKSYDMDRQALQAANIIGFWLDEQCPFDILMEVWGRTRKWNFPGSKVYTLTPLEPDQKLEEMFQDPPDSWRFYRLNTRLNTTLTPEFVKQIEENEIPELVETRMTGAFAKYEGAVYKIFDPKVHVIKPLDIPNNWLRVRGLDLGWNHYTACVWAARDLEGRYYVFREYFAAQTSIEDHVRAINDGWDQYPVRGHCYADPAAAQVLYEFGLRGLHTVPAQKDVGAGIATVQSLLRPGLDGRPMLLIFDTCRMLINQMRSYVYDPRTGKPKKETAQYLMDGCDALRYLCHSHRMDSAVETKPLRLPDKKKMVMV
jgi:phage terminase large subunit-like protein